MNKPQDPINAIAYHCTTIYKNIANENSTDKLKIYTENILNSVESLGYFLLYKSNKDKVNNNNLYNQYAQFSENENIENSLNEFKTNKDSVLYPLSLLFSNINSCTDELNKIMTSIHAKGNFTNKEITLNNLNNLIKYQENLINFLDKKFDSLNDKNKENWEKFKTNIRSNIKKINTTSNNLIPN